jgi:hypothetical protein
LEDLGFDDDQALYSMPNMILSMFRSLASRFALIKNREDERYEEMAKAGWELVLERMENEVWRAKVSPLQMHVSRIDEAHQRLRDKHLRCKDLVARLARALRATWSSQAAMPAKRAAAGNEGPADATQLLA